MIQRTWIVLAACLLAPAGAGLLRKLVPGQPAVLEPAAVAVVLLATAWLLSQRRVIPTWVRGPLLFWAYFQMLYALLAIGENWRIGVAATMIRIAPMLMAPIAYAAVRHSGDFRHTSDWLGRLTLVLLPIGFVVALFGQSAVPYWLQPIQALMELGRTNRSGVPGVAAVFSTFHVLGLSMMAVFYLGLANVAQAEAERRPTTRWWIVALSALTLVYLSTRRGAFLGGGIGLAIYLFQRRRIPRRWLLGAGAILLVAVGLEVYGFVVDQGRLGRTRSQLLLEAFSMAEITFRMIGIFLPHFWMWLRLVPFGTFLGAAGPEGSAMGWDILDRFTTDLVEVGAAQLLLEMGWAGALLMPPIVLLLMWRVYRRSRGLRCHRAVTLLAAYQGAFFGIYYFKELSAMTTVSMAQLFFWAVPGIAAGLVERERRERRYVRALARHYYERTSEQHA